jgi:hypothetical protein
MEKQAMIGMTTTVLNSSFKLLFGVMVLSATVTLSGQVSPDEIQDPRAKAAEERYLVQLQSLQQSIGTTRFPYTFKLARYLKAKPGQKEASDSSGIEFVSFQNQIVLKISGIYKAAFDSDKLSRNQRAGQTFQDAVVPILRIATQKIPQASDYDSVGFEIIYEIHDNGRGYDREGKEVLTAVFSRDDAFAFTGTVATAERQRILNRSDIFVNGEAWGLALGQRDPLVVEALDRSAPRQADESAASETSSAGQVDVASGASLTHAISVTQPITMTQTPATFADAMRLQKEFQAELDAIAKGDGAVLHLAEGNAPLFEIAGDRTLLHFTLRNTLSFDRGATSIYKRAAQSFDLFLAPELRGFSRRLQANQGYDAIEFSVLSRSGSEQTSDETIDYICPLVPLHDFVANKITSQDLINQSVVLVNGVRIGLNLQLVE